jgi:autotransporter-associated beta strand protein
MLAGSGTFTKSTAGTVTLTGANSYNGATAVNGGKLVVGNGTSGSLGLTAVTVGDTATLAGSGSIGGSVTVNSGGTLAPGNSPGILSTGSITLDANSSLAIELNGTAVGTQYDQVNVTGGVSISGALNATLGFAPTPGLNFFIINNDDLGSDAVGGTGFSNLSATNTIDLMFNSTAYRFQVSYTGKADANLATGGNDVVLTSVAIPEPATLSLLGIGSLAMLGRRRRR